MARHRSCIFAATAALAFSACAGDALAKSATAADATEKAATAVLTKSEIVASEKSAYEAWKSRNATFWDTFLAENFVGWGTSGKLDKVSAKRQYSGVDCDIRSYAVSEAQVSRRGRQAALITYKVTVDGTCGGRKLPASSWAAGVYVRDGGRWKAAFHAQAAVVDPAAPVVNAADQSEAKDEVGARPTAPDARAGSLPAIEQAVWEAWKDHDAKGLSVLMADDISFINIFGH